ncbi:MAG: hypothetical protein M1834_002605 [Cirrosporium novae-zelandiae]|nr:MAG: hypothetical protein M1834_002605 [Cirrosporium novae-zelandiae]
MPHHNKELLNAADFQNGLEALDIEIGKDAFLYAFSPIRIITAGGFLAVSFLKSRDATGDIDYLLDPEWAQDNDIKEPLHEAIQKVGRKLQFNDQWINEDLALFITKTSRVELFEQALEQNIILWEGPNLHVLAAPLEWALERKLRRIYSADRGRKAEFDLHDAIAILKHLRDKQNGPLDSNYIRRMNANKFDVLPDSATMDRVATAYQRKYSEKIFS